MKNAVTIVAIFFSIPWLLHGQNQNKKNEEKVDGAVDYISCKLVEIICKIDKKAGLDSSFKSQCNCESDVLSFQKIKSSLPPDMPKGTNEMVDAFEKLKQEFRNDHFLDADANRMAKILTDRPKDQSTIDKAIRNVKINGINPNLDRIYSSLKKLQPLVSKKLEIGGTIGKTTNTNTNTNTNNNNNNNNSSNSNSNNNNSNNNNSGGRDSIAKVYPSIIYAGFALLVIIVLTFFVIYLLPIRLTAGSHWYKLALKISNWLLKKLGMGIEYCSLQTGSTLYPRDRAAMDRRYVIRRAETCFEVFKIKTEGNETTANYKFYDSNMSILLKLFKTDLEKFNKYFEIDNHIISSQTPIAIAHMGDGTVKNEIGKRKGDTKDGWWVVESKEKIALVYKNILNGDIHGKGAKDSELVTNQQTAPAINTAPILIDQIKPNDPEIFYLPNPAEDGSFNDSSKSKDFIEGTSLYRFVLIEGKENWANFELAEQQDAIKRALQSPMGFIRPVCFYNNAFEPNITKNIIRKKPGEAELVAGRWIKRTDATISYEN
jgi:hypothetical protein